MIGLLSHTDLVNLLKIVDTMGTVVKIGTVRENGIQNLNLSDEKVMLKYERGINSR